ncbi:MAG TPA: hypothetical protein VJO34_00380 [Methylomirabilota bacterium]|nr:hypothetical protein [Methylomirabilota bacterium]
MKRARALIPVVILSALLASPTMGGAPGQKTTPSPDAEFEKLRGNLVKSMTLYRESLEQILAIYERNVKSLTEQVELRRPLFQEGLIPREDFEPYEQALAKAKADAEETRAWITEADLVIIEAMVRDELLKLPPLKTGGYAETASLMLYNGGARWSLADAGKIQKFFQDTFGRVLPVSAFGQTPAHDRMRFDHRDAMDVAIHPDSSEGRGLMEYLRKVGIPFLAFRSKIDGSATGAHIHIGKPSLKMHRSR